MTVGEKIKQARKKAGFTQVELGKKLGVSAAMINQYENGVRNPKWETLRNIAAALNVTTGSLIGDWDDDSSAFELNNHLMVEAAQQISNNLTEAVKNAADAIGEAARNQIDMVENMRRSQLLANYENVNNEGRKKIVAYSCDIADNPKYRKKDTEE